MIEGITMIWESIIFTIISLIITPIIIIVGYYSIKVFKKIQILTDKQILEIDLSIQNLQKELGK